MAQEIKIPEIGENVESGEVAKVLVSVGDMVEEDQAIIELETEKAVVEIPSPYAGKITEISVKEGDEVTVGQVIGKVEAEGKAEEEPEREPEPEEKPEEKEPEPEPAEAKEEPEKEEEEEEKPTEEKEKKPAKEEKEPELEEEAEEKGEKPAAREKRRGVAAGPAVRRLARELGADIAEIEGTGPRGRITPDDVKAHVKKGAAAKRPTKELPDFDQWGKIKREKMAKVRKLTAESTGQSWSVIPHVTQFDEADITDVEAFRKKYSRIVEKEDGKLTVTAILLKIIAEALKVFPRFNSSIDPDSNEIIYKQYYHIGMAVDTDRGLLVPVIRDVDQKSIKALAIELVDIADRTRNKKIKPDELEGGTFTISNQGGIGGTNFTPVVFWPQVAILGISRAAMKPVYREDQFEPRLVLPLSLSYDHRANDGADAARFLRWVTEALEHPFLLHFDK